MDRTPKPMEQYVHFKGGRYQVLNLAEMEDTGETLVIYQALYGEGKIYARTLSSFVSEVDRVKYPDAAQHWRFLRVIPPEEAEEKRPPAPGGYDGVRPKPGDLSDPGGPFEPENVPDPEENEPDTDPVVARFLDADSADEKLSVLASGRSEITNDMIDTMAFALGLEIEPGPVDERYLDLRECLLTISRYEMDRGRFRTT